MSRNKKHLKEGHQGAVRLVDANLFQGTESLSYYPVVFIQILTCQMPLVGSSVGHVRVGIVMSQCFL
jgi:hypothetical protein